MMRSPAAVRVFSLGLLLLLWIAAAALSDDPTVLPQPWMLLIPLHEALASGDLLYHLSITLARVIAAFFPAMAIGGMIGYLMGRIPAVDRWLDPWLVVFLNLPALVLIVLCYLWIGLNEAAAVTAVVLNKIPNVATLVREGARSLSPDLDAMARVYRMPLRRRISDVILPQLAPYIAGAARSGLAVIWKIVLVVEFLGRSSGIGFKIHFYFQLFDVARVLVYAISFIVVMLVVELSMLQPTERRVRAWRTA